MKYQKLQKELKRVVAVFSLFHPVLSTTHTLNKDLGGIVISIKSCCVTSSDFVRLGTPEQGGDTEVVNLEQITQCK